MAPLLLAAVLLGPAWASGPNTAEWEAIRRAMDEDFRAVARGEEELRALITAYQAGSAPEEAAEVRQTAREALKDALHGLEKDTNRMTTWRDETQLQATGDFLKGFMEAKTRKPTLSPEFTDLLEINDVLNRKSAIVGRAFELLAEEESRYADYLERRSDWRLAAGLGAGAALFAAGLAFIWRRWGKDRS